MDVSSNIFRKYFCPKELLRRIIHSNIVAINPNVFRGFHFILTSASIQALPLGVVYLFRQHGSSLFFMTVRFIFDPGLYIIGLL